ncbi:hypothetical protein B5C34_05120 [Pacificimonas flava]|uniref:Transmembrane protein n=2 Tax=Pacificimonas TaxID=1960290 RepID=A0A219B945_9SPHN|nr:TIGR02186 family protein [Pacificimonas aurantium]OWV34646.1 hypothetical protein B5C34_05120 [Pacificimonas flava]
MKPLFVLLAALCFIPAPAGAQDRAIPPRLIADLSQSRIDIVYTFAGAELLVFGAVQYADGRLPEESPDVVIVVRGPPQSITVRRKSRVLGLWLNTDSVRFETAPSFFRAASSRPILDMVDERTAAIFELSPEFLQLSPTGADPDKVATFEEGFLRSRIEAALYGSSPDGVDLVENVLYQARIDIPSAVPVGTYTVEIHLIQDGEVAASTTRTIDVEKSGFERDVYVAAQRESLAYGIASVALALILGWTASAVIRR